MTVFQTIFHIITDLHQISPEVWVSWNHALVVWMQEGPAFLPAEQHATGSSAQMHFRVLIALPVDEDQVIWEGHIQSQLMGISDHK